MIQDGQIMRDGDRYEVGKRIGELKINAGCRVTRHMGTSLDHPVPGKDVWHEVESGLEIEEKRDHPIGNDERDGESHHANPSYAPQRTQIWQNPSSSEQT